MARQTINSGSAPIVWSTVDDAFKKINANFTELYATIGGDGNPIDFSALESNMTPAENGTYDLGSFANRWRRLFLTSEGINIGNAVVQSNGTAIRLPAGSTIGNKLINDPADVGFGTIVVEGQEDIVADNVTAGLKLSSGSGVNITTDADTDTVTFTNTGLLDLSAGSGISISGNQNKTITNTGVTAISSGLGISVSNATGSVNIVNEGIVGLEAGAGISIGERSTETGRIVITNTAPATGILVFRDVVVAGQPTLSPQSVADRLEFTAGAGITLTNTLASLGNPSSINITNSGVTTISSNSENVILSNSTGNVQISFNNEIDIVGSVFSDNSILLVDGVNGLIPAEVIQGTFTGNVVGNLNGSVTGTVMGNLTGNVNGNVTGGLLGDVKGSVVGDDSSILVDGVGNKIVGDVVNNEIITRRLIVDKVIESFEPKTNSSGTIDHDCTATHIFFHTLISNNFTANFVNLNAGLGKVTEVQLVLNQGATAYLPTAVEINGAAQTILWQNSIPPTGNVLKTDIVSFTILNNAGTYSIYGQLTSFGT